MARRPTGRTGELETYRNKRDFRRSPEPCRREGRAAPGARDHDSPIFVIHKHAATQLHYDLRIEIDGVLKSWAVPKGPSTDPKQRRLAVHVEDHPLDYADFEGVIPEDQYGGGTVIVWDAGPYRNLKRDDHGDELPMAEALKRGSIEVWLEGRKLRGGYKLVRSKMGGKKENWLLTKMKDEAADARRNPVNTEPQSVLTGRTIEQVAEEQHA